MSKNFFVRLKDYYEKVGAVLRGEASAAAIFPNTSDIGMSREKIYVEFLRMHAPARCNVFLGGFIFDMAGNESRQLDVIVTNDTTPRFDLHNKDGNGKSFSPIEGTLGVVSVKSTLDQRELEDALLGIASIPLTSDVRERLVPGIDVPDYNDWPLKIIYASDGISAKKLLMHLFAFYHLRPEIPVYRRPNIIHVAGKYVLLRTVRNMCDVASEYYGTPSNLQIGNYNLITVGADLQGIQWTIQGLQEKALASSFIIFNYGEMINKINALLPIPPQSDGKHFQVEDFPEAIEIITKAAEKLKREQMGSLPKQKD
ncbi:MAG TPA: DUF6602 domain-containing protein [Burkholderiaceae bacterium]|nr:DUF6602 domain-containing protein [Burkholderiaceae bacterium]